ncbi:unnamed protein product, partial [Prorocentrum cordatum]
PDFCRDCGDLPRRKPATETQGTPPNVGCCLLRTSTGPHRTLVGHSHVEATPERRGRIGADPPGWTSARSGRSDMGPASRLDPAGRPPSARALRRRGPRANPNIQCRRRRPGGSGVPVGRRRRPLEEEEEEEEEHEEAKDEGLRD